MSIIIFFSVNTFIVKLPNANNQFNWNEKHIDGCKKLKKFLNVKKIWREWSRSHSNPFGYGSCWWSTHLVITLKFKRFSRREKSNLRGHPVDYVYYMWTWIRAIYLFDLPSFQREKCVLRKNIHYRLKNIRSIFSSFFFKFFFLAIFLEIIREYDLK